MRRLSACLFFAYLFYKHIALFCIILWLKSQLYLLFFSIHVRACACYTYTIIDIVIFLYNSNTYITIYLVIINNYLILKEFFLKVIFFWIFLRLFCLFFTIILNIFVTHITFFVTYCKNLLLLWNFFTILKTRNRTTRRGATWNQLK